MEESCQEIKTVDKFAGVCACGGWYLGVKEKDKKGYEGERRDKGKYLKFISKPSLTGLVLFIVPFYR